MARTKKRADGRYSHQIHLGKDANGKRKYKTVYADTDREAQRLAEEYRVAIGKGLDPEQAKATLGQLYENLIAVKKAKGIGQKSLDRYEDNCNSWGPLKDMPAGELKASDFQRVLNELADWHNGKPPLSHFTLTNLRSSAKAAYGMSWRFRRLFCTILWSRPPHPPVHRPSRGNPSARNRSSGSAKRPTTPSVPPCCCSIPAFAAARSHCPDVG